MFSADEFIKRWNGSELSRIEGNSVVKKFIPAESFDFLVTAGLPERTFFEEDFSFDLSEESLKCLDEKFKEVSKDSDLIRYIKIAEQYACITGIDIQNQKIYIIWEKLKETDFLCSGILELAELIVVFEEVNDKFRNGEISESNKPDVTKAVVYLKSEVNRIDPQVLVEDTLWKEMIYELELFLI